MACGKYHKRTKSFFSKAKGFFKDFGTGFKKGFDIATKVVSGPLEVASMVHPGFGAAKAVLNVSNNLLNHK